MEIHGDLNERGLMETLAWPARGGKTGDLILRHERHVAVLHYRRGALIGANLGDAGGIDALAAILDWREGEYELHLGQQNAARTLDGELEDLLLRAIEHKRLADGRDGPTPRESQSEVPPSLELETAIDDALQAAVARHASERDELNWLICFDLERFCLVASHGELPANERAATLSLLGALRRSGPSWRRFIVERDDAVHVGMRRGTRVILGAVSASLSLGAASVLVGRVADRIEHELG
ncbi:MAG: DUF4388 domain-containing protein [Myxococcales bacterium]|nr:DUF4388 domain-containing protein [Myxococcales bacterium]